jgi:hypothetical protein
MFFDETQINDILNCKKCKERLDSARFLPCGSTICSKCISSIEIIENQEFNCLTCSKMHVMPKEGLALNDAVNLMLSLKPTRISRGKAIDSLIQSLDEIQKVTCLFKNGIASSVDNVKEYCTLLRNEVQVATEEAIQQIIDFNDELKREIDEYEKECIEFNTSNHESKNVFYTLISELELFHKEKMDYLKQTDINEDIVIESKGIALSLSKKADGELKNLKDSIFKGKFLKFDKNKYKLSKSSVGCLSCFKNLDSLIVLDKQKQFMSLCEFTSCQKWNLLYRATQDGFEATHFHSKCDNKPNTLVIIKSENGNVFGGYTEQSWEHSGGVKQDSNAFVFSFINSKYTPLKMKCVDSSAAIWCDSKFGPYFNGGFMIDNNSNTNTTSLSELTNFKHSECTELSDSNDAKSFLAGSYNFKTFEIEVYTKE